MGGAPTLVKGKVHLRGWRRWRTKVSSVGDIEGNTRIVC